MVGTMRRSRRSIAAFVAASSAVVLVGAGPSRASAPVPVQSVAVPATASSYADGFRIQARSSYTLDPPGGVVHVALDATITNQKPDQAVGNGIRQFYLPAFSVPVLSEAVGLQAVKSDGTVLPVSVEPSDSERFSFAVVDLRPDLYYPSSQTFRLSYDLPGQPPRSAGFTRLNDAYATFPVLAVGDPEITDVEVLVPEGFEVELVGDDMDESERDGLQAFTATAIDDPSQWQVLVSARDDRRLSERAIDLGDHDVKVLGWPDDPEWTDFAATQVTDGVPVLEDLIGIDWPATSTIEVVETASPYLYGYAGWYRPVESVIEVGDELDQHVMLHELAHLWFNDDLFEGRWINEAFADQMAAMAVGELGGEEPVPEPIDPADPGRLKLNDWSDPDLQAGVSEDQERYGYNASWAVMHAIVEEIGAEDLATVVQAADTGQVAYRGPGVPEELARTFDWRELLDLLEEVGGSDEAAGLFQVHVVGDAETGEFEARATARAHYAELLEAGEGWAAPTSIRLAMADWRFDAAEGLITDATDVLATKAEVAEVAAGLDVSDDLALQGAYEAGKDMDDLSAEANTALTAARDLREAEDAHADGAGPLGVVGLLFSSVRADLADAQASFDDGDYAAVSAASAEVESALDDAAMAGILRLGAAIALLLAILVLRRIWRNRRDRRTREAALAEPAPTGLEADGTEGVGGPSDGGSQVGV